MIDEQGSGELIRLLTSILEPDQAPTVDLAEAYHQQWQHEQANGWIKTCLRGSGKVPRSQDPGMIRQEIYGYPLTYSAISGWITPSATTPETTNHRSSHYQESAKWHWALKPRDWWAG